MLTGRGYSQTLKLSSYLFGVGRKVEWERIRRPQSNLAVYYLAVCVDRKVEWLRIL
jgi:hypothetical protein